MGYSAESYFNWTYQNSDKYRCECCDYSTHNYNNLKRHRTSVKCTCMRGCAQLPPEINDIIHDYIFLALFWLNNQMDVGSVTWKSFDIDAIGETEAILSRTDTGGIVKNRWLWRSESEEFVILEKSEVSDSSFAKGTLVQISQTPGYVAPVLSSVITSSSVAKIACEVDFNDLTPFTTKTITDANGATVTAVLVPVILL